jgi:excisionase family DNA binding protein
MEEPFPSVGQRLRTERLARRVWQRDLAAAGGLSAGYLSQLEQDQARATAATWRRLALALGLDERALADQAEAEGRLAPLAGPRGNPDSTPLAMPVPQPPAPPPRPIPAQAWLTVQEAAAALGLSRWAVTRLIRRGRLAPARRVHAPGERGRPRWRVAASAVRAYRSPNAGYAKPRPAPPPDGFLSLQGFAEASGLSWGTLHRRLESGAIPSVRVGRRRFIPEAALARWRAEPP